MIPTRLRRKWTSVLCKSVETERRRCADKGASCQSRLARRVFHRLLNYRPGPLVRRGNANRTLARVPQHLGHFETDRVARVRLLQPHWKAKCYGEPRPSVT